jgi:Tol biopolymer transport system component
MRSSNAFGNTLSTEVNMNTPALLNRHIAGGSLPKLLLLLLFVALFGGWWMWKNQYGLIGHIQGIPESTVDQIVFVKQGASGTDLYLVSADGSKPPTPLVDGKGDVQSPTWSPDGKKICFAGQPDSSGSVDPTFQLFLVGKDKPQQITYGTLAKSKPQWRAGSDVIGFLSGGALKTVRANGDDLRQVYPIPHRGTPSETGEESEAEEVGKRPPIELFRWSPNGKAVVAVQVMEGEDAPTIGDPNWFKKHPNTSSSEPTGMTVEPEAVILLRSLEDEKPLLLTAAKKVGVAWTPDSERIVLTLSSSQKQHALVVMRVDDQVPKPLLVATGYTVSPENPEVSPDGTQVAFEVWKLDSAENRQLLGIAVISLDTANPIKVVSPADISKIPVRIKGQAKEPKWSPDGTRILYTMPGPSGRDLWVAKADGSQTIRLTKDGDNFDAAWSPARK